MSYITIDKTKCKACYLCLSECPKKLLKIGNEVNHLGEKLVEFNDPNHECLGLRNVRDKMSGYGNYGSL